MQYVLIVDKQSRLNPSNEKKSYVLYIEELRTNGSVSDELIISPDESYVMRKLKLSEYQVLSVLENPIKEVIENPQIELFEGDNYIYLVDTVGNKFYAEYLIKNDFNDTFITKREAKSQIDMASNHVVISVNEKLQSYSTTEEMNAAIEVASTRINLEVSKKYYNASDFTSAKIIAEINGGTSSVLIQANKVDLSGYVTVKGLSGGTTTINGACLTTGTINASKCTITNINASNIATGTLDASKITVKNISASNITTGTIDASKITVTNINANNITTGTIDASKITVTNINASNIITGTLDASKVTVKNLDANNITTGTISANRININGTVSANGNFKIGTDGKMQCTGAKISVSDSGLDNGQAMIIAEGTNYRSELYSDGLYIENKNSSNSDFVMFGTKSIVALDDQRYGFDFGIGSDGKLMWGIKDANGKLLSAGDTQFILYSPGQATYLLLDNGGAYINGYKIQTNTSDARLKDNIQNSMENALEKIMQIRHRSFNWKESGVQQKNGYIAQELEKIDAEFIINENDKYSINVLNLLATTTKAMQEQQELIEKLQKEIETIKK